MSTQRQYRPCGSGNGWKSLLGNSPHGAKVAEGTFQFEEDVVE